MDTKSELELLCRNISTIRSKTIDDARKLERHFPPGRNKTDARANALGMQVNTIEGFHLSLQLMRTTLDDPDWWAGIAGRRLAPEEVKPSLKAFYEVMRVSFVQLLVSAIDTPFRRFLAAVRPGMCADATGPFKNIYECLLKALETKPKEGVQLLELLRLTRNAIHTNGYHDGGPHCLYQKRAWLRWNLPTSENSRRSAFLRRRPKGASGRGVRGETDNLWIPC